jgi:hypothetical protein
LVTIANAENLLDALAEACGKRDGWLSAVGYVDSVELRVATEGADARRNLRGRFTLANFAGAFGGPYFAVIARHGTNGAEFAAGELLAARSAGVTASLWEAPSKVRDVMDAAPPRAEAEHAQPQPAASSWAQAAQAVAESLESGDDDELPQRPERGDLVRHFAFGLCEVLQDTGDRLKLRDLHGPGRIREIAVEMLEISLAGEHQGKRVFKLDRRR